ncbi:MAG: knotted carbamoyltransferase YgeW, partial [Candidatus Cloacimonetes bacterium]|nr:knotted carbamoyltransferase YgeW [Candidatus Cloacimonadota bacterium]
SFTITGSMAEAFRGADVVCPKSWASFQVMEQRRDLLHAGDLAGLEDLERKCLAENAQHRDWECNSDMMKLTSNALYMHPLPADVSSLNCEFGEVSREIFEASLFHTYTQAGYKPFIIAAMIFLSKIRDPREKLISLISNPNQRKNISISEDKNE